MPTFGHTEKMEPRPPAENQDSLESPDEARLQKTFDDAWDALSEEERCEERVERELLLGGWIGSGN